MPTEPACVPAQTGLFGGAGAYNQATYPNLHRYPDGLPPFLSGGHSFQDIGVAEDFAFEQGEDRARQIYTFNPQIVDVSTELNQSEFDLFWTWYEEDLRAGAVRFDVQVAEQGGAGLAWWAAQFVAPYNWEALGRDYVVSAQLLLLDGPYATRTAPGLTGRVDTLFQLGALSINDSVLRGAVALTTVLKGLLPLPPLAGRAQTTTTLTGYLINTPLYRLFESGESRNNELGDARVSE